jgi:hypothetical protein
VAGSATQCFISELSATLCFIFVSSPLDALSEERTCGHSRWPEYASFKSIIYPPEVVIECSVGAFLILVDLMDGRITSGLPVNCPEL